MGDTYRPAGAPKPQGVAEHMGMMTGDLPGIRMEPSPNSAPRGGARVTYLVWHYTAGATLAGAVGWLTSEKAAASAHFVIGRDGQTVQLVPLARSAWHAGAARVSNAESVGIEAVNPGIVTPDGRGGWTYDGGKQSWRRKDAEPVKATLRYDDGRSVTEWWVPYTPAQEQAMVRLVGLLNGTAYGPCTTCMCGHEDIAEPTGRKTDPGPLFPWHLFPGRRHVSRTSKVA